MTGLITLLEPVVLPPDPDPSDPDPESIFAVARRAGSTDEIAAAFSAQAAGLPLALGEGDVLLWSIREVRHLRFIAWLVEEGRLAGDTEAAR